MLVGGEVCWYLPREVMSAIDREPDKLNEEYRCNTGSYGVWSMEDGRWKMEDGRWKMEDGRGEREDGVSNGR